MESKEQIRSSNRDKLAELLDDSGVSVDILAEALSSIRRATELTAPKERHTNKLHQNKEYLWEDDTSAYIYTRGTTTAGNYYVRIYDKKSKQRYVKSLGTANREKAMVDARVLYKMTNGRIEAGQRAATITTQIMVDKYLAREEQRISPYPKVGITKERFRLKVHTLKKWMEFIEELGFSKKAIQEIPPHLTRDYGYWVLNQPRKKGDVNKTKSHTAINNHISEIKRCYMQVGVRDRYIGRDDVPEIDRLGEQVDAAPKKDILTTKQYEKLWRYCEYKYCLESGIDNAEKQKRIIFTKSLGLMANLGTRVKELLGLRISEVYPKPKDKKKDNDVLLVEIRATNSKTGKSRIIAAPIKKRIEIIKKAYEALGKPHQPNDYLLFNPTKEDRRHYTREQITKRFRYVLKASGLKEELDAEGKNITFYSFRHQWITWRIRYGDVPIAILAKAAGTSIQMIDKTYSKILVEKNTEVLTKAQGALRMLDVELSTELYNKE